MVTACDPGGAPRPAIWERTMKTALLVLLALTTLAALTRSKGAALAALLLWAVLYVGAHN